MSDPYKQCRNHAFQQLRSLNRSSSLDIGDPFPKSQYRRSLPHRRGINRCSLPRPRGPSRRPGDGGGEPPVRCSGPCREGGEAPLAVEESSRRSVHARRSYTPTRWRAASPVVQLACGRHAAIVSPRKERRRGLWG